MKKLVLFALAAVAISFASCGGNKVDAEKEKQRIEDSIKAATAAAEKEAAAQIDTLAQKADSLVNTVAE